MHRYTTTLFTLILLFVTACAHGHYKRAYIAGAVTKEFVTEAHGVYDERANEKLAECDPAQNPDSEVKTKKDLDACLTDAYKKSTQEKIVQALGVYKALAIAYTAVMLGCEPNEDGTQVNATTCAKKVYSDDELREWRGKLVDAAVELLELFPDAGKLVNRYTQLVGK